MTNSSECGIIKSRKRKQKRDRKERKMAFKFVDGKWIETNTKYAYKGAGNGSFAIIETPKDVIEFAIGGEVKQIRNQEVTSRVTNSDGSTHGVWKGRDVYKGTNSENWKVT